MRQAIASVVLFMCAMPAVADGLFLRGAAEIDDEGGYWVLGGLAGELGAATRWSASLSRSDVDNPLADSDTTAANARLTRAFGPVALELGGRWWQYADVIAARVLRTGVTFEGAQGYVGVAGEFRRSDFEPFAVATLVELGNGTLLPVTATADCDLDDRSVGIHAGWFGERWHVLGEFVSHDYDAASCGFDSPGLERLMRARRDVFVQLAGRVTTNLSRSAARRVTEDNAFLDHRWGIAAGIEGARVGYRLRYDRAEEVFAGLVSETYTFGVSIPRASGTVIDLYAGATSSDGLGTAALVGVSIDLAL